MKLSPPLAAVLVLASAGCSLIPSFSVTPRYGLLEPRGDVSVSSASASAASDVETLGLEEEGVFAPRADFAWGPLDLMANGFATEFEGRGVAEAQLDLGGVIINQGETVDTSLDLTLASLIATFELIPTDLIDFGLGFGATYVDFDADVRSVSSGQSVGSAEEFVLPVLAARLGSRLGPVRLGLTGSGLSGSYEGMEATVADLDFSAEFSFGDLLPFYTSLVGGYRYVLIEVEYEEQGSDIDADVDLSGVYFGLTVGI